MKPHSLWFFIGVILGICLAMTAVCESGAASFDCGKAKGAIELAICAAPDLSKADETLNKQ
jgi:uncharacterized protein